MTQNTELIDAINQANDDEAIPFHYFELENGLVILKGLTTKAITESLYVDHDVNDQPYLAYIDKEGASQNIENNEATELFGDFKTIGDYEYFVTPNEQQIKTAVYLSEKSAYYHLERLQRIANKPQAYSSPRA